MFFRAAHCAGTRRDFLIGQTDYALRTFTTAMLITQSQIQIRTQCQGTSDDRQSWPILLADKFVRLYRPTQKTADFLGQPNHAHKSRPTLSIV